MDGQRGQRGARGRRNRGNGGRGGGREERVAGRAKRRALSEGFDRSDDDDAGGEACDFAVWTCDGVRFVGESAESKPEEYVSVYEEGGIGEER